MNRELLEKPFEPGQIRQRRGRNGLLDYVEGHSVIQRLNEALEGQWSFEIAHHEVREEEVLVLGRLTAGGVVKTAFGTSQVTRERESGKPVSLGDDLKAASTDCLKKCATLLGVGLHLYAEKPIGGRPGGRGFLSPPRPGEPPRPAPPAPRPPGRPPADGRAPVSQPLPGGPVPGGAGGKGRGGDGPVGKPLAGNGPVVSTRAGSSPVGQARGAVEPTARLGLNSGVTPRQLDAIWKVASAKGLEPAAVESMSLRVFNRKPDALTREEASSLIRELSNLKRRVA
jgi:hypothetical protein